MSNQNLQFELTVEVPVSQLYRAFTHATALREWFCDAAMADPRPGGRLYFWWNDGYYACGEFTTVTRDEQVAFTWRGRDEPGPTQVELSMMPQDEKSRLTVTHSGFGSDEAWTEALEQFQRGWEVGLENLKSVLETGQDQRYVLRPMLGILVEEFSPEIAAELSVPVSEGIRLGGVVEGMGAEAAGLQEDDVIVAMAGAEVTDFPSLTNALSDHRAGDQVEVLFYRGAEKKTATMELSRRPLPDVPETPETLAQAVQENYVAADAEIAAALEGISEPQAAYHAEDEVWNVKEVLAHLIANEREWQAWIADLINDAERWSDRWENSTTVPARLKGTLAAFPTVSALLEEYRRARAETVAMLSQLPPEFVQRKGSYTRLAYALLEMPGSHEQTHLEQIQALLEKAREQLS